VPTKKSSSARPTVVAIYCPLWHSHDHWSTWKGEGWNEWELVKGARPRFPGHHQPLRPSWGCFDESDPRWAAREIDLAADHDVDVFLFDWYWYSGVKIMEEALEKGFLRAPNRRRMKFALMWANHTWGDYFPAPYAETWNNWLPMRHSPRDFERAMDYCIEHYLRQPNYWQVEGKLFFSLFLPFLLVDHLGGAEKTKCLFQKIDRKLHHQGFPSIHWNAMTMDPVSAKNYRAAGFHSTTSYNVMTTGRDRTADDLLEPYENIMQAHRDHWRLMQQGVLPHFPVVTMGWDVTPRCRTDVPWPFPPMREVPRNHPFNGPADAGKHCYPYIHVVTGNTPEKFGQLCREAAQHSRQNSAPIPAVFVNAWNEWTEGCYLLPEKKYGIRYLQALQKGFSPIYKISRPTKKLRT
jgi:hypothetical protein